MQEVQSNLPIGSAVGDRYVIEDLLGKGGFGAVYLVRDQRVRQNLFALKEVVDPNKRERDRFTFECEVLRRLDHPALPHVYRVFKDDVHNRAYMLMDYVEGPNLEILRQQQPGKRLLLPQVLTIMAPIMNAISYLHNQHPSIIHRDIKPANIIVPVSGDEAALVDFGIAKEYDPNSTTTAVRHCSPGYGAPEQYGIGTNTRTNIYGLGATIYALLTGVVPADAFYRTTQLVSKGTDPLEPVNQLTPNIPSDIADAIHRAMDIDSNKRFPTVQDFWQALNAYPLAQHSPALVVLPVTASRPHVVTKSRPPAEDAPRIATPKQPATPAPRSRRKLGILLLILLVLLIGLAAVIALLFTVVGHHPPTTTLQPRPTVTHVPTLTPSPAVTAQPSSTSSGPSRSPGPSPNPAPGIPALAIAYTGTIHNIPANETADMSLSSIRQNGVNISGIFTVSSPLVGSGPFTGTVDAKRYIQFTVYSSQVPAPLFFTGQVQADGSLKGDYCSLGGKGNCNPAAGGFGTWNVFPQSPRSSSSFLLLSLAASIWYHDDLRADRVLHIIYFRNTTCFMTI